jgi:hypothetical protein
MDILLQLLTDPKVLGILTLPVVCMVVEAYVIWKLFKLYSDLQEKRHTEVTKINDDYINLSNEVNKTLDLVVRLVGNKRNGNGGCSDGK